jgi:hypothetical protein
MSAPSPALSGHSPAEWVGNDGADLPLAECWREATGASEAALIRAFPGLRDGGHKGGDATLTIVKRAMRDFEGRQYLRAMELIAQVAQGPLRDFERMQRDYDVLLGGSSLAAAVASMAAPSVGMAEGHAAKSLAAMFATYQPVGLEALASIAVPLRSASVEILGALEPYHRLDAHPLFANLVGGLPAAGLPFSQDAIAKLYASVVPSSSWLASLSLAVDGSLMSAVAATLDAQTRLVQPFALEGAAWRRWLPRFPDAIDVTSEADPGWLSAEAHVLTRTAIAAAAPDRDARDDRDWIVEALEKAHRLSWDLDLTVPGTRFSLAEALESCDPVALTAVRGAMEAIAWRRPDAARHAAVSLREAVKSFARALTPGLPANAPARDRLRAAVGFVLSDPDHAEMVSAQIELLVTVRGPTGAAVHGRGDDVSALEVMLKGVLSALCAVIAGWAQSGGVIRPRD